MPDVLRKLIDDARNRVQSGYYNLDQDSGHEIVSFKRAIKSAERNAIIGEIKPVSLARGSLRPQIDPVNAAVQMANGGTIALSILTEPDNFGGSLENLRKVRDHVSLPLLMKDIIIHEKQIEAGRKAGADCVLLIESAFSKYPIASLTRLIRYAHESNLEVLLEVHTENEFQRGLKSEADIVGVNNRNLSTLETDLNTTLHVMARAELQGDKVIISESGFESAEDIRKVKSARVDGFLIGSSLMVSQDLERKVREFVLA
ncbi:MAG TPA: indole-3-glycerol-phosphate synthase [Candidatus Acidoferrales bacterium]|nr:indole-3-glycerol-phosphate synthase [Candidatus Acidoferrales bacterium]